MGTPVSISAAGSFRVLCSLFSSSAIPQTNRAAFRQTPRVFLALGQHFGRSKRSIGAEARYLGAPSFAYRVGPYTINKDASIDGEDLEPIRSFLIRHDYIHQEPAVPQPAEEEQAHAEEPLTPMEKAVASAEETSTPSEETATESITETDVSAPISELTACGRSRSGILSPAVCRFPEVSNLHLPVDGCFPSEQWIDS